MSYTYHKGVLVAAHAHEPITVRAVRRAPKVRSPRSTQTPLERLQSLFTK